MEVYNSTVNNLRYKEYEPLFCRSLLDNDSNTVGTSITSIRKKPPETQNAIIYFASSTSTTVDQIDGVSVI